MRLVRVQLFYLPFLLLGVCTLTACEERIPETPRPTPVTTISISPSDNFTIMLGASYAVRARVTGEAASAVRFRSSQPSVVVVDSISGVIRGDSLGIATITATVGSGATMAASAVDVTVLPPSMAITSLEHRRMVGSMITDVCPNQEESLFLDSLPNVDLRVIHEFHDCQRLIDDGEYQSVVGIYAHRNLTNFPSPTDYTAGHIAAIILNYENKGPITYTPLGLAPGISCLVLKWNPAPVGTWEAAVVHDSSPTLPPGGCTDSVTWSHVPVPQSTPLKVILQQNAAGPDTITRAPPVARWDWDSVDSVNYIGVRCGEFGWCEIGGANFTPRPALVMKNGKNMFKGYYDEQFLADKNGALSDVFGTVSPPDSAVDIKRNNAWHKAAIIELVSNPLSVAYEFYSDRLQLQAANAPSGKIRGTGTMTMMSPPLPVTTKPTQNDRNWNVRVNGLPVTTSIPGQKMKHTGHMSESTTRFKTVRWRWNENDETVWSFCEEAGCCEMGRLQQ
jgi:hypothetical protein